MSDDEVSWCVMLSTPVGVYVFTVIWLDLVSRGGMYRLKLVMFLLV